MLVEIEPRLVWPRAAGDYFTENQVETWGIDAFWGLPEYLEASANARVPLQLLALLRIDASLATPDQVQCVPDLRARPATARRPAPG